MSKINEKCLLKLTKDCFHRMNKNFLHNSLEQHGGGGGGNSSNNMDSIIPYFLSHGITKINKKSEIPMGLLLNNSDLTTMVTMEYLNSDQIRYINNILSKKPKNY